MLIGAAILLVGIGLGRISIRRERDAAPTALPLTLGGVSVCGCGHHLSMHDPTKKDCHGLIKNPAYEKDRYISNSNPKEIKCKCRQFITTDDAASIVAGWTPPKKEVTE